MTQSTSQFSARVGHRRTGWMQRMAAMALPWIVTLPGACTAADPASHWAFQPVRDPQTPAVRDEAWCRTPLDRFILARLEAAGTKPGPVADPRTLLRRASYGLTGLPPSADELDAIEADATPDAINRAVERLLSSPGYGEHWGRHWLDVVRYADTAGETADYPVPVAWRYRNYVIDAFNQDKPYDQFLREQIAGDILARTGPRERYAEQVTATGFLAISRRFGFDSENYHHLTIQDTIDTVGQGVLGLTLGCARCHAHKYDPVPMSDYYALYGIFESTRYAFPGSEQKQRVRALAPLVPPEESAGRWREFERKVAALAAQVAEAGLPVPSATLRSLDEMDGDFELQAPAAGGSKGVLVPPWTYAGPIAVTTDAQSPFRSLFPTGRVGAALPAGTNGCRLAQALHPARRRVDGGLVFINLDFRVTDPGNAGGSQVFKVGSLDGGSAFAFSIGATGTTLRTGDRTDPIRPLTKGEWVSLQLDLDLDSGRVAGSIGTTSNVTPIASRPIDPAWNGNLDQLVLEPESGASQVPGIEIDNIAIQRMPIPPRSTQFDLAKEASGGTMRAIATELREVAGIDGDFELQTDGTPPGTPWGPGPNSVVKIHSGSQSPFTDVHPPGRLGIHMPNSGAYNGFGQTLTNRWFAKDTRRLHAAFDFRTGDTSAGGAGTWRYYLGHGPGGSPAVELCFNGTTFFRRSGDARDPVRPVTSGEWNQVRLELDLEAKRYTGSIRSAAGVTEFEGAFAPGWDGSIDYTFIDSYGHLEGTKPALDADNFVVGESPLPSPGGKPFAHPGGDANQRRNRFTALKERQEMLRADAASARADLERMLIEGPFELAYAVSEGTPQDARLQLRGEPDRPGEMVPRGFVQVLGTPARRPGPSGSGRLELAEWLTSPANPLTARVMVNRIWQYHFGQGLVHTPNDFGLRGQRPTDPALLDWLASRFIESGWSVKAMHRLILSSAVYRQGNRFGDGSDRSDGSDGSMEGEPGSFQRRRLAAEEIRDSMLLAGGALEPARGGGHAFPSATGWGYTQHGPFSAVYDHGQRSVYLMTQRIKRHPFLALFDGPDPNASTPERRTTTVPTQALYFLNDPFVHASAARVAERALAEANDDSGRIRVAYRRILGRSPTAEEMRESMAFIEAARTESGTGNDGLRGSLASLSRVLFGSNEFLTVD